MTQETIKTWKKDCSRSADKNMIIILVASVYIQFSFSLDMRSWKHNCSGEKYSKIMHITAMFTNVSFINACGEIHLLQFIIPTNCSEQHLVT